MNAIRAASHGETVTVVATTEDHAKTLRERLVRMIEWSGSGKVAQKIFDNIRFVGARQSDVPMTKRVLADHWLMEKHAWLAELASRSAGDSGDVSQLEWPKEIHWPDPKVD
jgi:hypothetical protein